MKRRSSSIHWLRFGSVPWGTVYLMQARNQPDLFKVGFTKRRTIERRSELNRVASDDLKIVWFRKGNPRGSEWFKLRKKESIANICAQVEREARQTKRKAKFKLSWPKGLKLTVRRF